MTRADLKHCGKIPEAKEELNRSVREGIIESRHSIKSLEGLGSSSHDLGVHLPTDVSDIESLPIDVSDLIGLPDNVSDIKSLPTNVSDVNSLRIDLKNLFSDISDVDSYI